MKKNKGQIYVIATPIGNLSDITYRAIEVLNKVDFILCEDTRISKKLLQKYGINTKLISYHKFNENERLNYIIKLINDGNIIGLISDAGTPCICDPGRVLINKASDLSIKIIPIPGPCTINTFLSAIKKDNDIFTFLGFLPREKNLQTKLLKNYKSNDVIFYESPNRILKTLENIKEIYGKNIIVSLGRELTKIYEEIKTDNIENLIQYYKNINIKGEFIVMIHKYEMNNIDELIINIDEKIKKLKAKNFTNKDIVSILTALYNINKNDIYPLVNNK